MPEGPSILLMKEKLMGFVGQKVLSVRGNVKTDIDLLIGKTLVEIRTFGKQTYLVFGEIVVRIHLLLFGSYSIDEQTKTDRALRLYLQFANGDLYFYTCSVKILGREYLSGIEWASDVLSDAWQPRVAKSKLQKIPGTMVCDALLDQEIFAGVGNIIKNEVLFRTGIQPESLVGSLPAKKLQELIGEARKYSFEFLEWKRAFVLKKHWQVHTKKICPKCNMPLVKKNTGVLRRRSFYCLNDQKLYQ